MEIFRDDWDASQTKTVSCFDDDIWAQYPGQFALTYLCLKLQFGFQAFIWLAYSYLNRETDPGPGRLHGSESLVFGKFLIEADILSKRQRATKLTTQTRIARLGLCLNSTSFCFFCRQIWQMPAPVADSCCALISLSVLCKAHLFSIGEIG